MKTEDLRAFVSRLTGSPITGDDEPFSLGSARKAQVAAWLRGRGVAVAYANIDKPSITINSLLGVGSAAPVSVATHSAAPEPAPAATPQSAVPLAGALRVGIDIHTISSLPVADDYRTHKFYRDNFSPRELAHCLSRGDPHASLGGLWAAKEAVLKAGAASADDGKLAGVEIAHDTNGAPAFPGCALSISHEGDLAVAVCIATAL